MVHSVHWTHHAHDRQILSLQRHGLRLARVLKVRQHEVWNDFLDHVLLRVAHQREREPSSSIESIEQHKKHDRPCSQQLVAHKEHLWVDVVSAL